MRCKQMLSLSVVTVLLAASLAGCGTSSTAPSAVSSEAPSSAASSAASEVTETAALPDGVYTAEFDTDSGMFHANEACDGKGTLTVKDGKMTFHVSLVSKKIVNLYPGLAADAEAHKTDWLLPTTDTVTYSDGTSEEVYGYDIPVTALDTDFPLAILGSKGTWYDHTVSVRNAQPTTEETSETPADGEYTVSVALEGGSGRATVDSPATLTVADGKMTATIAWSSPNYDYMVVDGEKYLPKKPRYFKSKSNIQDGHEAIRPTTPSITPEMVKGSVTTDQYKIYKLVWERFIASLMENCLQETMKIEIVANGYVFNATGYTVKFDGFTVLYEEKGDDGKTEGAAPLPPVKAGDKLRLKSILGNQHFTQPPARYTEASLTKALEENGVGRPSTYVTITSTIVGREYVKREGKQFVPTELGEAVTKLLEERMPNIVDVKYTSKMEADLDKIDSGDRDYIDMIRHYYEDFEAPLEKAKKEMQGVKIKLKEEETDVVCEKCGRNMVIKVGRYGKFLACPGYPECKNTKPLVFKTKAKCPVCGADVIEKKTRRGTSFYGCSAYPNCNFMTWDVPTDEVCPQCGKSLFKKRGNVLVCLDEKCGFSKPAPKKKKEQAEE